MAILGSIAKWILRMFLSGLFGKMNSDIENDAKNAKDSAKQAVTTVEEATTVEKEIIKKQGEVAKEHAATPKPADDPFGADKWNAGK